MREREYAWYVEALDARTNLAFSNHLAQEDFQTVRCADGKPHNLWPCPDRKIVQSFWDSQDDLGLKFEVFSAEIKEGKTRDARIRKCTFLFKRQAKAFKIRKRAPASESTN